MGSIGISKGDGSGCTVIFRDASLRRDAIFAHRVHREFRKRNGEGESPPSFCPAAGSRAFQLLKRESRVIPLSLPFAVSEKTHEKRAFLGI
jgi:hypothetical protein